MDGKEYQDLSCTGCGCAIRVPVHWGGALQCVGCGQVLPATGEEGGEQPRPTTPSRGPVSSADGGVQRYSWAWLAVAGALAVGAVWLVRHWPERVNVVREDVPEARVPIPLSVPESRLPPPSSVSSVLRGDVENQIGPATTRPESEPAIPEAQADDRASLPDLPEQPAPIHGKPASPPPVGESVEQVPAIDAGLQRPGLTRKSELAPPENWPKYAGELKGSNEIRIDNPNDFAVLVGVRSGGQGKDFTVPPRSIHSVWIPSGEYQLFLNYRNEPNVVYAGDKVTLRENHGVAIRLVQQVGGNYGIRRLP